MMQINLKAHNATDLEFFATVTLTSELIAGIHKLSPPDADGDSAFLESYEKHRAITWVYKANEKTLESRIDFNYETKKGGRLSKKLPRISQLMDLLSTIGHEFTFECRASFQFGKKLHAKSIVHLPQRYFELPDMPFDRIQGMHLVKLDGSETKYDIFLESPTSGVLLENVLFKYSTKFYSELANDILNKSVQISNLFIVRE